MCLDEIFLVPPCPCHYDSSFCFHVVVSLKASMEKFHPLCQTSSHADKPNSAQWYAEFAHECSKFALNLLGMPLKIFCWLASWQFVDFLPTFLNLLMFFTDLSNFVDLFGLFGHFVDLFDLVSPVTHWASMGNFHPPCRTPSHADALNLGQCCSKLVQDCAKN